MPTVKILPLGIEVFLSKGRPLTDLEFELDCRTGLHFGCKVGACGVCAIEVVSGADHLGEKTEEELAFLEALGHSGELYRLACLCHLHEAVTIRPVAESY